MNTCVDLPHTKCIHTLCFRPRGATDSPPMAVTTSHDGKFKLWLIADDTNIYSKCEQEERRGARVMHVGMSVCMSVWTCNSKTIASIDLISLHKKYYARGSVLLQDDPDLDSRIYLPLRDMTTMSCHVRHSERWSVISDCLVCLTRWWRNRVRTHPRKYWNLTIWIPGFKYTRISSKVFENTEIRAYYLVLFF